MTARQMYRFKLFDCVPWSYFTGYYDCAWPADELRLMLRCLAVATKKNWGMN